jgi:ParB family chromosome partitioning protein
MKENFMINKQKNSLGRGLAALLGEVDYINDSDNNTGPKSFDNQIDINLLKPGKMQPRQQFDNEKLQMLVESIKDRGMLQPIVVRTVSNNQYEIIAGERRWRAAKDAGLKKVPVKIYECDDRDALELGLIENLQRDDLNPIEEGDSLKRLIETFNKTQDEVAQAIRKSRSYVANLIRLGSLPEHVKDLIRSGKISAGHARALITSTNIDHIVQQILSENLSVRETEQRVKQKPDNGTKVKKTIDPDLQIVAESLQEKLGLPVNVDITKKGGSIKITFDTYEQLDQLVTKIQQGL